MITLSCPAKVNLFLAILGKDTSGYHEIDTVFVRVPELADTIEIEPADNFIFECETVPGYENTVVKAVLLLEEKTNRKFSYHIHLTKNIPLQSGLGGGSSDAAAILTYLNEHEKLGLTPDELMGLGTKIGMDVPFFISGYQVAHGTHYGEKIVELPSLPPELKLTIGFTGVKISTKEAYEKWDSSAKPNLPPAETTSHTSANFIAALRAQDSAVIIQNLHNDFERIFRDLSFKNSSTVLTGSGGAYAILT